MKPEWVAARVESEEKGPLLNGMTNETWVPTDFSPLQ